MSARDVGRDSFAKRCKVLPAQLTYATETASRRVGKSLTATARSVVHASAAGKRFEVPFLRVWLRPDLCPDPVNREIMAR